MYVSLPVTEPAHMPMARRTPMAALLNWLQMPSCSTPGYAKRDQGKITQQMALEGTDVEVLVKDIGCAHGPWLFICYRPCAGLNI